MLYPLLTRVFIAVWLSKNSKIFSNVVRGWSLPLVKLKGDTTFLKAKFSESFRSDNKARNNQQNR